MFYFFKRGPDTITCEVRPSATGSGFDIVILEPGGEVRTEHFSTSAAVHARWLELKGFRPTAGGARTSGTDGHDAKRVSR